MSYVDVISKDKTKRMIGRLNKDSQLWECRLINVYNGAKESAIDLSREEMAATLFILASDEDKVTGMTLTMYGICGKEWDKIEQDYRMIP